VVVSFIGRGNQSTRRKSQTCPKSLTNFIKPSLVCSIKVQHYTYILHIIIFLGNVNFHDDKGNSQGIDSMGSTLHFGPGYPYDPYEKAHGEK